MRRFFNNKSYMLAAAIAFAAVLVFLPSLQNGFVDYDDDTYIYNNPYIRSLDFNFFKWAFGGFHAGFWIPLTWLSYAIEHVFWGLNPTGYHLTNAILHGLNTFLVVMLVVRLVETAGITPSILTSRGMKESPPLKVRGGEGGVIAAAVTGLLFGLHPIHVESVAWATERKDVLYAFFFLLSIMSYMRYAVTPPILPLSKGREGGVIHFSFSLGFFLLSLLSKPMAVTLPVVLLILDWYPLRRFENAEKRRFIFMEKIPFFVLSLACIGVTMTADHSEYGSTVLLSHVPLSIKILVALKAMPYYLGKMLWPNNLIPYHPYPKEVSTLSFEYLFPVIFAIGITATCIAMLRKQKIWLAVCAYFIVTLLPVARLTQQAMADRFTYLPSAGPFLVIGLGAAWFFEKFGNLKNPVFKIAALSISAVVVISMSYATIKQIRVWKDSVTMWSYVIEKEQKVPLAYNNRGAEYETTGQYEKAIEDFNASIALDPTSASGYYNRGATYEKTGQYDKAIKDFSAAITFKPDKAEAYHDRGVAYGKIDQYDRAIEDLSMAIALNRNYAKAYSDRGAAYDKAGQYDRAIEDFSSAIALNPGNALAYSNRGIVYYFRLGRYEEALKDFTKAIELNPNSSELYSYRGNIYKILGRLEDAERDFMEAERTQH